MNDLRSFAALQTRVYEFLERQDEATLRAIISGSARLDVVIADGALQAGSAIDENAHIASFPQQVPRAESARDPAHVAKELSQLPSERRRSYLSATRLTVSELKSVAKELGLSGCRKLRKAELFEKLINPGLVGTGKVADQSRPLVSWPSTPTDGPATMAEDGRRPSVAMPPAEPAQSNAEAAHIASHLRGTETEEEGAVYLRAQQLDRETLLAVATELHLTRVDRLSRVELERRVLNQAIGARRKFAGLRKW